jgi:hypothetical protein
MKKIKQHKVHIFKLPIAIIILKPIYETAFYKTHGPILSSRLREKL